MMEAEIKVLLENDGKDFVELVKVFANVFDLKHFVMPSNNYLESVLAKPDFLAVVAKVNDQVVGGLTAYVLEQYYSEKPIAYIYDVAVLNEYQRQGIGNAIIQYFKAYCIGAGLEEIFVQADRNDDHALSFYRSTHTTNEVGAVHFSYSL